CRAFLGALAVRNPGDPETTRSAPARAPRRSTRITGGGPDRGAIPLRQPVPAAFPVLDGLASGTLRRRKPRPLAAPRALLPAPPSFRECPQVHGGLRAPGRDTARHEPGRGRRAPENDLGDSLLERRPEPAGLIRAGRRFAQGADRQRAGRRRRKIFVGGSSSSSPSRRRVPLRSRSSARRVAS